jgi:MFS family permease
LDGLALHGCVVSGLSIIGTGTVADIYPSSIRGQAMNMMILPSLAAPIVGPVIGGAIIQYLGWRYIFLVVAAITGMLCSTACMQHDANRYLHTHTHTHTHTHLAPLFVAFMIVPETRQPTRELKGAFNPFIPLKFMITPKIGIPGLCRSLEFSVNYLVAWSLPILAAEVSLSLSLSLAVYQRPLVTNAELCCLLPRCASNTNTVLRTRFVYGRIVATSIRHIDRCWRLDRWQDYRLLWRKVG